MLDLKIMKNEIQLITMTESADLNSYLGFGSRNDVTKKCNFNFITKMSLGNDFKLWVIGSKLLS